MNSAVSTPGTKQRLEDTLLPTVKNQRLRLREQFLSCSSLSVRLQMLSKTPQDIPLSQPPPVSFLLTSNATWGVWFRKTFASASRSQPSIPQFWALLPPCWSVQICVLCGWTALHTDLRPDRCVICTVELEWRCLLSL